MNDFDNLLAAHQLVITEYLSNFDLVNLAKTSKAHFKLFQPLLDVPKFLHYVARGEHVAVQMMLQNDSSLIVRRGVVRDCSRREFGNISGFEYALWALDKHMWAKMIECIPQNEKGRKVFKRLIAQYHKVNTDGVTYKLNGKTITENHFDFENTLIKELQTQVESINAPGDKDWNAINEQWRVGVGGAQKQLPMHIVDEYCFNEPFYPVPDYISQPKSSKQFFNWTTDKYEDWFSIDSKLGSKLAIYKGRDAQAWGCGGQVVNAWPRTYDLDAMKALCEVRTLDLINLKSQLEKQVGMDNHYPVVLMRPS